MTLPNERTRAVISAAQFLTRLTSPYVEGGLKKIPATVRAEARAILRHFPRSYDLHDAAKACPDVFDEQEILRYDEEQTAASTDRMLSAVRAAQSDDYVMSESEAAALSEEAPKNRPTVEPETLSPRPDTAWMDADELMVDPPSGWRYGFPKVWNRKTHPDMTAWLIENGYPPKAASDTTLHYRFMSVPKKETE